METELRILEEGHKVGIHVDAHKVTLKIYHCGNPPA